MCSHYPHRVVPPFQMTHQYNYNAQQRSPLEDSYRSLSFVFEDKRVFWSIWFPQPPTSQIAWKALLVGRETLLPEGAYSTLFISWIKIDQLEVTRFIISLFTAQHVSNVSAFIFRSLRLIVDLSHGLYCSGSMCVGVTVWFGWGGVVSLCRLKH